jgi:hypothetical protein
MARKDVQARAYTDAERAEAVGRALAIGTNRAAAELDVPARTLRSWIPRPEYRRMRTAAEDHLAASLFDGFVLGVETVVERIAQGDASLRDVSVATGILADKWLLLSGRATSRTEHINEDAELSPHDLTWEEKDQLGAWLRRIESATDEELRVGRERAIEAGLTRPDAVILEEPDETDVLG